MNGCYAHHAGALAETSLEQFSQALQGNLTAAFFGTQTAVVRLRAAGRKGAIINMSSVFADRALAGTAAYAASAGGIRSLSKSAALACAEAGDGIHIHTVMTGHYEGGPDLPAGGDSLLDGTISVGEVAALVVQLAGDGATYTHGSAVTLDGGLWISLNDTAGHGEPGRLAGKRVLITGATSGIGRGCAMHMAEEGARLIFTGRNEEGAAETLRMVREVQRPRLKSNSSART